MLPAVLGPPFGTTILDLPARIPLPAKITIRVLKPVDLRERLGRNPDPDEDYKLVTGTMQRSLTQPGSKPEDAGAGLSRAWRLLHRTLGPDDAIARGGLTLEGPRRALERFVEAFAWSG